MRWGIKKGRYDAVQERAGKKLNKLNNKVLKYEKKANAALEKANRKQFSRASQAKKQKAVEKAAKAQNKYLRAVNKADKWYKSMEKEFSKANLSTTKAQQAVGKAYVDALNTARSSTMSMVTAQNVYGKK